MQKGISVKTNKEKAIRWSAGFEIGGSTAIKGVTLKASFGSTAQTGYDANDQMIFTFGHTGYICGTNRIRSGAPVLPAPRGQDPASEQCARSAEHELAGAEALGRQFGSQVSGLGSADPLEDLLRLA